MGGRGTVHSVRFDVGVSLLLAPARADKRGPNAPFPLVGYVGIQPAIRNRVPAGAPAGAGSYWKHWGHNREATIHWLPWRATVLLHFCQGVQLNQITFHLFHGFFCILQPWKHYTSSNYRISLSLLCCKFLFCVIVQKYNQIYNQTFVKKEQALFLYNN